MAEVVRRTLFLSYAREDEAFARALGAGLDRCLASAQIATTGDWNLVAGADYEPQLEQMIRSADALVFVLTTASAASAACLTELEKASGDAKRIIPVARELVPDEKIPPQIRAPQWVFATNDAPIDVTAGKVADAVLTDFDLVAAHTELLTAARSWEAGRAPLLDRTSLPQARALLARLESSAQPYPAATPLQIRYVRDSMAARRRRTWTLIAGAAAVSIILTLLGLVAYQQSQARRAENGLRLAFAAQAESRGAPERLLTSGTLAAQALQLWPSAEGDAALRSAVALLPRRLVTLAQGSFEGLTFSAAGRQFAAVENRGMDSPKLLRVWRTADWQPSANVEHVETFAFLGPARLAMLTESGKLRFLDVGSDRIVPGAATVENADTLAADRMGRWVAVADADNSGSSMAIHDAAGRLVGGPFAVPGLVLDMRFDGEGARLAIVSNTGFVGVVTLNDMNLRSTKVNGAQHSVHFFMGDCLVTSGASWDLATAGEPCLEENSIVSVSPSGRMFVQRAPSGATTFEAPFAKGPQLGIPERVHDFAFDDGDRLFAYATNRTVHVFDAATGAERARICFDEREAFYEAGNSGPIEGFALSPDGARVVVTMQQPDGNGDPTLAVYETSGVHARLLVGGASVDGALVATDADERVAVAHGDTIAIVDPRTGKVLAEQKLADDVGALAFDEGGAVVAVTDRTSLWRWEWKHGRAVQIAAAPEGATLELDAAGGFYVEKLDAAAVVRELTAKRALTQIRVPHTNAFGAATNGSLVAAGDLDGRVSLWWRDHPQPGLQDPSRGEAVNALRFSPGGSLLAAATGDWGGLRGGNIRDGEVVLWHMRSRRLRRVLPHPYTVWDVDFSRDGRYVVSIAIDRKVRVWETGTGRQLSEIPLRAGARTVRFCDGDRAVVAANEVHDWRAEDLLRTARPRLVRR